MASPVSPHGSLEVVCNRSATPAFPTAQTNSSGEGRSIDGPSDPFRTHRGCGTIGLPCQLFALHRQTAAEKDETPTGRLTLSGHRGVVEQYMEQKVCHVGFSHCTDNSSGGGRSVDGPPDPLRIHRSCGTVFLEDRFPSSPFFHLSGQNPFVPFLSSFLADLLHPLSLVIKDDRSPSSPFFSHYG
jgi:hypothetical protein